MQAPLHRPTRFSSDMAGGSATAAAEGGAGPLNGLRLRCAVFREASCVRPRSCAASPCGWATAVMAALCCRLELLQLARRCLSMPQVLRRSTLMRTQIGRSTAVAWHHASMISCYHIVATYMTSVHVAASNEQQVAVPHLHPWKCLGGTCEPMKALLRPLVLQCAEPSQLTGGAARGSDGAAIDRSSAVKLSVQAQYGSARFVLLAVQAASGLFNALRFSCTCIRVATGSFATQRR